MAGWIFWELMVGGSSLRMAAETCFGSTIRSRLGSGDAHRPGGAEIGVYDVNGDGLNDVVTVLQAHGWGIAWLSRRDRLAERSRS
jgi:hypothetical protein